MAAAIKFAEIQYLQNQIKMTECEKTEKTNIILRYGDCYGIYNNRFRRKDKRFITDRGY